MLDRKTQEDIEKALNKDIDPKAIARVADEVESMGNVESADWMRTHLKDYFAELFYGTFRKFLNRYGRK